MKEIILWIIAGIFFIIVTILLGSFFARTTNEALITNEEIIQETRKCQEAGMRAKLSINSTRIWCLPIK